MQTAKHTNVKPDTHSLVATAPLRIQLTPQQKEAINPAFSVWSTASAGSGKTKVLTDRLLTLMCSGAAPEGLLCLTFTRAAAAEMRGRAYTQLQRWSTMSDKDLQYVLQDLGLQGSKQQCLRAQQLFERVLALPQGLRIQTVHSFAESLLGRFALEVGLQPHFHVIDEAHAEKLIHQAMDEVLQQQPLVCHVRTLAAHLSVDTWRQILVQLVMSRGRWHAQDTGTAADIQEFLGKAFGLKHTALSGTLFFQKRDWDVYQYIHSLVHATYPKHAAHISRLQAWKHDTDDALEALTDLWLTKTYTPRRHPFPRDVLKALKERKDKSDQQIENWIAHEAQELLCFLKQRSADHLLHINTAFLVLVSEVLKTYAQLKKKNALLDYEDLILETIGLLEQDNDWIRYKLDGGVDHLLVDEAQDTSAPSWRLLVGLMHVFFDHTDASKTLFVVGDPKQSIYSFQGAEPVLFQETEKLLANKLQQTGSKLKRVPLTTSFRSSKVVLQVVDQVFQHTQGSAGVATLGTYLPHTVPTAHQSWAGSVRVWPVFSENKEEKETPSSGAPDLGQSLSCEARCALNIAMQIKEWVDTKLWLDSKQRGLQPADVLVLVRKRGRMTRMLHRFLKEVGLPVVGQDRFILKDTLVVQDLLATARFCLYPEDDMNLATLLKGPFVGLTEEALFACAHGRSASLWHALQERARQEKNLQPSGTHDGLYAKIIAFLEDIRSQSRIQKPAAFFTWLLWEKDGIAACAKAFGVGVQETIDVFLDYVHMLQDEDCTDLAYFLTAMDTTTHGVTKDTHSQEAVRVLTVHGAKGLEAPVVVLADAISTGKPHPQFFWTPQGSPLLPAHTPSALLPHALADMIRRHGEEEKQEYSRLLYVGLTRASEHVIVTGACASGKVPTGSWYALVKEALSQLNGIKISAPLAQENGCDSQDEGLLFVSENKVVLEEKRALPVSEKPQRKTEKSSVQHCTPLAAETAPFYSISITQVAQQHKDDGILAHRSSEILQRGAFQKEASLASDASVYGEAVHRLLAVLPTVPQTLWSDFAQQVLSCERFDEGKISLPKVLWKKAAIEAINVLKHPALHFLRQEEVLREVELWHKVDAFVDTTISRASAQHCLLKGRLDVLWIDEAQRACYIVDYKTGLPAIKNKAAAYDKQLQLYSNAVKALFPAYRVSAGLIWTRVPSLQWRLG